jgi:enoyl-CoA hydratase
LQLPPTILFEKRGPVALVTMNRAEALNALTAEMVTVLEALFAEVAKDDAVRVMILTGAGEKSFCSGLDLKEAIPLITSGASLGFDDWTKRQLSDVWKPVIAAVNGHCIAGGTELLAGTDLRIAAEHATFGLGEVRWGLIPAGGSHVRIPRQIPWAVAMELLLTGRAIDARRAHGVGLVNEVVPPAKLMETAFEWAERIARNGPLAVRTAKEIAVRSLELEPGFVLEKALAARVLASSDAKEGPRAFAEKRAPRVTGS